MAGGFSVANVGRLARSREQGPLRRFCRVVSGVVAVASLFPRVFYHIVGLEKAASGLSTSQLASLFEALKNPNCTPRGCQTS